MLIAFAYSNSRLGNELALYGVVSDTSFDPPTARSFGAYNISLDGQPPRSWSGSGRVSGPITNALVVSNALPSLGPD
jgi:hypothetical protein